MQIYKVFVHYMFICINCTGLSSQVDENVPQIFPSKTVDKTKTNSIMFPISCLVVYFQVCHWRAPCHTHYSAKHRIRRTRVPLHEPKKSSGNNLKVTSPAREYQLRSLLRNPDLRDWFWLSDEVNHRRRIASSYQPEWVATFRTKLCHLTTPACTAAQREVQHWPSFGGRSQVGSERRAPGNGPTWTGLDDQGWVSNVMSRWL